MSLEARMIERARRLVAHAPAFIAATGAASEEDAYERFTFVNDFPTPGGEQAYLPFAVISLPLGMGDQSVSTSGSGFEMVSYGGIEICYLRHIGDPTEPHPPSMQSFIHEAGKIRKQIADNLLNEDLPESAEIVALLDEEEEGTYVAFASITPEYDMEREPYKTRENKNDYMDVGWRLSLPDPGGADA